jgi:hypothetical protein
MSSNGVGQRECLPVLHRSNHVGVEKARGPGLVTSLRRSGA